MQRLSHFRGLANAAEIRTALYEGREHLVIPCVALRADSVIEAMGSKGPEFVSGEVIARSTIEWDDRPCVGDHPKDAEGRPVSATSPEVRERESFGRIANPRFQKGALQFEAWLDPSRAELVGNEAVRVIDRARAHEMIEVSIGAWVEVEQVEGVSASGERYVARWTDIGPNHISLLPEGAIGACSVQSGCGAPRVAMKPTRSNVASKQLRAADKERGTMADIEKDKEKAKQRNALLLSRIRLAAEDEGVSVSELREKLFVALRAVEPGFDWVQEIYPDSSTVIYTVWPEKEMLWYRRTFALADDGEVTLNDDREQVEPVLRYEPVAAMAAASGSECTCHKQSQTHTEKGAADMAAANVNVKVKEAATRLIANARSPYTEEYREHLEALDEGKLIVLEASFAEPESKPTAPTPPATPVPTPKPSGDGKDDGDENADTVPVSKDELASLRRLAAKQEAQDRKRKDELVATLKGAQKVHSEASLKTLSLDRLEEMAELLELGEPNQPTARGAASYVGRTLPIDDDEVREIPDPYNLAGLTAARKRRQSAVSGERAGEEN